MTAAVAGGSEWASLRSGDAVPAGTQRRWLVQELWLVFALSLGASAVNALVQFIAALTAGPALATQTAVMNGSSAPGRPWLDLTWQLLGLASGVVPVLLVMHLLTRGGEATSSIGLDGHRVREDAGRGTALAALVGGCGLGVYLAAHQLGLSLTVVPEALPALWWRIPVLVAAAAQNALLEEVLVAGFLLHRLRQLGWSDRRALTVSAVLRGSYHLYQGLGGFVGNLLMGLLFGRIYQKTGRTGPLVLAHFLIDSVAFVGYSLLAGHVSWIPS